MLRAWFAEAKRNWKAEKSPKRNMMNGVTSIRNLTPHQIWDKVSLKSFFDFIDECAKEAEKEEKKEGNAKEKIDIKKPLPIFSLISENQ